MTTTEVRVPETAPTVVPEPAAPPGNPAMIGVPTFVVGSIALGLVLTGYVPAAATGASIPIIMTATGGLLTWLIVIVLLTLASLHLPLAFSVLFVLIDLALLFVFLGTANASTTLTHIGGYLVFAFMVVGAYLFVDAMSSATGGRSLPLGRAILG